MWTGSANSRHRTPLEQSMPYAKTDGGLCTTATHVNQINLHYLVQEMQTDDRKADILKGVGVATHFVRFLALQRQSQHCFHWKTEHTLEPTRARHANYAIFLDRKMRRFEMKSG